MHNYSIKVVLLHIANVKEAQMVGQVGRGLKLFFDHVLSGGKYKTWSSVDRVQWPGPLDPLFFLPLKYWSKQ